MSECLGVGVAGDPDLALVVAFEEQGEPGPAVFEEWELGIGAAGGDHADSEPGSFDRERFPSGPDRFDPSGREAVGDVVEASNVVGDVDAVVDELAAFPLGNCGGRGEGEFRGVFVGDQGVE